MSTSNPSPDAARLAVKPRNPVERLLVRGFIVVMLVLIAVEGWSKYSHYRAITKLQEMTKAVDEKNAPPVTETDVIAVLGGKKPVTEDVRGKPGSNGAGRLDIYSWFTVSPIDSREIYVYYGLKGKADQGPAEVLSIQTKRDVPVEPLTAPAAGAANAAGKPPGMSGAPGAGAPGAAGRPGSGMARPGNKENDKSDAASPDSEKTPDDKPADDGSAESADDKDPQ
jgi:hypothetical protein